MATRGQKAGSTLAGGLGGAGLGATIGSIIPGVGTAIGAGLGALLGGGGSYLSAGETDQARAKRLAKERAAAAAKRVTFADQGAGMPIQGQNQSPQAQGNWWSGMQPSVETYNQYTPEQQLALSQILQQSLGNLGTNAIEESARKNFSQRTIPTIAERFSQLGAQRSSAFPQLLSQAASDLESNLASMKEERANRLIQLGLKPQFDSIYRPGSTGFGQQMTADLLRSLLSGENIGGGLSALRDAYKNRGSQLPSPIGMDLPAVNIGSMNNMPTAYQSQTWTSNPANLVRGTSVPGGVVPGIGTAPSLTPGLGGVNAPLNTGFGAMRGLGLI